MRRLLSVNVPLPMNTYSLEITINRAVSRPLSQITYETGNFAMKKGLQQISRFRFRYQFWQTNRVIIGTKEKRLSGITRLSKTTKRGRTKIELFIDNIRDSGWIVEDRNINNTR